MQERLNWPGRGPWLWGLVAGAAALGACAAITREMTRRTLAANPPRGRFVAAGGMRLHYTEHGDASKPPLVLLHGNAMMARELELSGLVREAAREFRVLVFDRPGYGHSQRPAGHSYTPQAQAEILLAALRSLGVRNPVVLGHSWGALVAFAMALRAPNAVRGLVLVSGYYMPSLRLDTALLGLPAVPVLGTLMRHSVSPLLGRLLWPMQLRRMFAPQRASEAFRRDYPLWMSLRPGQLAASSAEMAMLPVEAARLQRHARELSVPAVLLAGEKDHQVMTFWQSGRLHRRLPASRLHVVPGAGHMVHHTDVADVLDAIHEASLMASGPVLRSAVKPGEPSPLPLRQRVTPA
jgi:pimeloyl-ACP methyl ester carboxylesterase